MFRKPFLFEGVYGNTHSAARHTIKGGTHHEEYF